MEAWNEQRERRKETTMEWVVLYCDKERKVMEARFLSFSHYTPPFLVLCAVMCGVKRGACVSLPRSLHFQHTTEQEQTIHLSFLFPFKPRILLPSFVFKRKGKRELIISMPGTWLPSYMPPLGWDLMVVTKGWDYNYWHTLYKTPLR